MTLTAQPTHPIRHLRRWLDGMRKQQLQQRQVKNGSNNSSTMRFKEQQLMRHSPVAAATAARTLYPAAARADFEGAQSMTMAQVKQRTARNG